MGPVPFTLHYSLFFFFFFAGVIPSVRSEIKTTRIAADARPLILFEQFGFDRGGCALVSISGVSWRPPPQLQLADVDPMSMGFFLVPDSLLPFLSNESEHSSDGAHGHRFCPLASRFVVPVLLLQDLELNSSCSRVVEIAHPDEYSLLFGSCQPGVEVTMDVRTEMYNVGPSGGEKDYLPAGKTRLPKLYSAFSVVYFAFFVAWAAVCARQRAAVEKIHLVMAALLLFKALKMACAAEDTWYVRRTGTPHGWDVAFYVFGFFKGVLLFTVIVLIGTGWSFIKPYLQVPCYTLHLSQTLLTTLHVYDRVRMNHVICIDVKDKMLRNVNFRNNDFACHIRLSHVQQMQEREKNVLMIVIPMQVIENIASAVIGETGPAERDWLAWNQIFLLVGIVCCAAVFFPIIWSIRNLREASKTDGKAARNLEKLTLFKQFYVVVVGYLYFTRIVAAALSAVLSYRCQWVVAAAVEGVSLAFYVFTFYNFQPVEKNPYLYIGDEEEAAAAGMLEMEERFEL
ncbi:Protein GPR108 [Ananas comosus]|uniref:Protein GPR108 n=1 Tax=Ananas comosus TaxID=4615 RepID=A0A199UHS7_ANACO|nr:Protein GPR108 [Ananas comosus]